MKMSVIKSGKYASQNGNAPAVRHYHSMYKNLNESTVQTRVEKAHKIATKAKLNLMKYCLLNRKGR